MPHWTSENDEAFINRITFDFIAQLEKQIEEKKVKQSDLAQKLGVSEGAVSQVLNLNRRNPTLVTMFRYARALGMKVAIVAYDDGDPENKYGPVGSELFSGAWQKLGNPRDVWELNAQTSANVPEYFMCIPTGNPIWNYEWMSTTERHRPAPTAMELPPLSVLTSQEQQHGETANA